MARRKKASQVELVDTLNVVFGLFIAFPENKINT